MSYQLDSIFNRLKERGEKKKNTINESDFQFLKKFGDLRPGYQYPQPIEEIFTRLKVSAIRNGQVVNEEKLRQQAWMIRDRQIFEVSNNSSIAPSAAAAASSAAGAGGSGGGGGNRRNIGNHYIDDDYIDDGYYE